MGNQNNSNGRIRSSGIHYHLLFDTFLVFSILTPIPHRSMTLRRAHLGHVSVGTPQLSCLGFKPMLAPLAVV